MGCALSAAKEDEVGEKGREETIPLEAMPTESDHTSGSNKENSKNEKGLSKSGSDQYLAIAQYCSKGVSLLYLLY